MSEQLLIEILSAVKTMDNRLSNVEAGIISLKTEVNSIRQEMVTKSDIEENTTILRALEHASQVNAAEMEGLRLNTASKEYIERLDAKFDVLNERLFKQETELQLIKIAK